MRTNIINQLIFKNPLNLCTRICSWLRNCIARNLFLFASIIPPHTINNGIISGGGGQLGVGRNDGVAWHGTRTTKQFAPWNKYYLLFNTSNPNIHILGMFQGLRIIEACLFARLVVVLIIISSSRGSARILFGRWGAPSKSTRVMK